MPKLSDTQSVILTHAAGRESGSLYPLPKTLRGSGGTTRSIATLVSAGLADERETIEADAVHRSDGDLRYGLFVTTAGLAAIGVVETGEGGSSLPPAGSDTAVAGTSPRITKSAMVLGMLGRSEGATLAELIAATGWLPHTTRAALTSLRKKGHAVVRTARGGASCYRIEVAA